MNAKLLDRLRLSSPMLAMQTVWQGWQRSYRLRNAARSPGTCPLCGHVSGFAHRVDNPREDPLCPGCGSVPRQRALVRLLAKLGIELGDCAVHESSPSLCTYHFLRHRCESFVASYWLPGVAAGARVGAFENVDLGAQAFADATFDLVVTQDVLEHVPDPERALREIHRTLRPGGRHVFSVPRTMGRATTARAELRDGVLHHLLPAEFHRDPIARRGALVVTDWGEDLEAIVERSPGVQCAAHRVVDAGIGVPVELELFVATKRAPTG